MSATRGHPNGPKVELPKASTFDLTDVEREYAEGGPCQAKRLAALHLHTLVGWPVALIARLFGHSTGTSSRHIQQARHELIKRLELDRERELQGRREDE